MTISSVTWFGDRAVMVGLADGATRSAVAAGLSDSLPQCDVRAGMESVLVASPEPDPALLAAVERAVAGMDTGRVAPQARVADVTIPVDYTGADLQEVARMLRCSVDALVAAHQEQVWAVAMMGFAAGFGYLVPQGPAVLDWSQVARRDRPRERVPAGSVALAAGMSAVYPEVMPGGWHLLGHTTVRMFDAQNSSAPSLLRPSAVVRFTGVDR